VQRRALEAAEEALLRLYRNPGLLKEGRSAFPLLARIAVCRGIDLYRAERVRDKAERPTPSESLDLLAVSCSQVAEEVESTRYLWDSVAALPTRERQAVQLVFVEGLSRREGAERMKIDPRTFKSLLCRALRQLKRSLKAEVGE
tara:strand:- start:13652 stop:14083 length:432 start_codon:yes stop_codon:yes gene_type:complete